MNLDQIESFAWLIIAWCVFAPFVSALAVHIYYRVRYREGLAMQRHFSKGLFE